MKGRAMQNATERMRDDRVIGVKEIADILSVTHKTVYTMARKGLLPVDQLCENGQIRTTVAAMRRAFPNLMEGR